MIDDSATRPVTEDEIAAVRAEGQPPVTSRAEISEDGKTLTVYDIVTEEIHFQIEVVNPEIDLRKMSPAELTTFAIQAFGAAGGMIYE